MRGRGWVRVPPRPQAAAAAAGRPPARMRRFRSDFTKIFFTMFQIFLPQVIDLPINREPVEDSGVIPRYSEMKEIVEQMTVNIVKEQLNRS